MDNNKKTVVIKVKKREKKDKVKERSDFIKKQIEEHYSSRKRYVQKRLRMLH